MHEENKGTPKIAHDSSLKAPTRNSNCKHKKVSIQNIDEKFDQAANNWFEYRMAGRGPDRRAYHATFIYDNW